MGDGDAIIRPAERADYPQLAEIMFEAVREGPSAYTEAQRAAWVPAPREGRTWTDRLAAQDVVLVEQAGTALGFMSLAADGYIDFAYCRPGAQGRGYARLLFERLEALARSRAVDRLWAHVSLNGEAAFAAFGFTVRARESVTIGGQQLLRAVMEKCLSDGE